jgi:hypothetical protein
MNYWSDERQRNGENRPRPFGLRRKSRQTRPSPMAVATPLSRARTMYGAIFAGSAIHPSSVSRP